MLPTTFAIRLALVAAAGVASAAYLAFRTKSPAPIVRELGLASLDRQVGNWLPKLPFVRYIRLGVPGTDFLKVTGDGTVVRVHLLRPTQHRRSTFRRTCARLGIDVTGLGSDGDSELSCEVPADRDTLVATLESLLRDVFHVSRVTPLVASIPVGT